MPTLSEYAKLETDPLMAGVMENIVTANALMPFLQFKPMEGNSLKYNRESTLPTAAFLETGGTMVDTEATYTAVSSSLTTVYVQSPVDRYAQATRGSVQDQKAVAISGMAKSLGRKIAKTVIQGNSASGNEFEGLTSLAVGASRVMAMDDGTVSAAAGSNETELTIDRLDAMIDEVVDGDRKPDVLIMNTTMRRKLTSLARAAGSGIMLNTIEMFGRQIDAYNGIPIVLTNWITNAEQYEAPGTWGSSTATTIFGVVFGEEEQGHVILHNGSVLSPDVQELGTKFDHNEDVFRLVVYIGAALFSVERITALGGIDSTA